MFVYDQQVVDLLKERDGGPPKNGSADRRRPSAKNERLHVPREKGLAVFRRTTVRSAAAASFDRSMLR
jgi:hypothetical protein